MAVIQVAVLVGSLRKESNNLKVAKKLQQIAPASMKLNIIEIGDLALYNEDLDSSSPPASYTRFRNEIKASDAVLFITPEYNRSVPAALKNAIDVGSRPYGQNAFVNKPCAVVSSTIGGLGAFGANHHVRQSLVFLDMYCMAQPECYLSNITALLNDEKLSQEILGNFINAFETWATRFLVK